VGGGRGGGGGWGGGGVGGGRGGGGGNRGGFSGCPQTKIGKTSGQYIHYDEVRSTSHL